MLQHFYNYIPNMMARMHIKVLLVTAAAATVLVTGLHQASRFWWSTPDVDAAAYVLDVFPGDSMSSITPLFAAQGVVNGFWFKVYVKLSGKGDGILPGAYAIAEGMSYATILNVLRAGATADVSLTIPEGFTIAQIGARVHAALPHIAIEEWTTVTGQFSPLESHAFVVAAGKPDDVDLEGYLFPDTYRFSTNATAEDIVRTMIDTMQQRVEAAGLGDTAVRNGDTERATSLHDALTLASIVEKEVRQPETMAMVADIFYKRLSIGMALQSDATVNYVTGGDDPSISLEDTDLDTPYNTYKYPGLPPGPISNPGANALAAVASPIANDYLYFLTSDEGEIYYATTHDEHVANKERYLR